MSSLRAIVDGRLEDVLADLRAFVELESPTSDKEACDRASRHLAEHKYACSPGLIGCAMGSVASTRMPRRTRTCPLQLPSYQIDQCRITPPAIGHHLGQFLDRGIPVPDGFFRAKPAKTLRYVLVGKPCSIKRGQDILR